MAAAGTPEKDTPSLTCVGSNRACPAEGARGLPPLSRPARQHHPCSAVLTPHRGASRELVRGCGLNPQGHCPAFPVAQGTAEALGRSLLGRASPAQGLPLDTAGGGHERGGVSLHGVGGESREAKGGGRPAWARTALHSSHPPPVLRVPRSVRRSARS